MVLQVSKRLGAWLARHVLREYVCAVLTPPAMEMLLRMVAMMERAFAPAEVMHFVLPRLQPVQPLPVFSEIIYKKIKFGCTNSNLVLSQTFDKRILELVQMSERFSVF